MNLVFFCNRYYRYFCFFYGFYYVGGLQIPLANTDLSRVIKFHLRNIENPLIYLLGILMYNVYISIKYNTILIHFGIFCRKLQEHIIKLQFISAKHILV